MCSWHPRILRFASRNLAHLPNHQKISEAESGYPQKPARHLWVDMPNGKEEVYRYYISIVAVSDFQHKYFCHSQKNQKLLWDSFGHLPITICRSSPRRFWNSSRQSLRSLCQGARILTLILLSRCIKVYNMYA